MNDRSCGRRRVLGAVGSAALVGLAGCLDSVGLGGGGGGPDDEYEFVQIGSGREGFEIEGGTPIAEMPDLSGTIDVYSGRGEALVGTLFDELMQVYPDLDIRPRYDSAAALANRIQEEGQNSAADVFFTVNAGALGTLADAGRARTLPDDVLSLVREGFRDPDGRWTGTSGRVRSIPYNTDELSASDIPDDIFAFPEDPTFENAMGWAPSYSSFQAFVTAMRILNGADATREWLAGMIDAGVQEFSDEFQVAQAVADGEVAAGFANHYYTIRVQEARPNAPIDLGFTEGDAGVTFNVAGALVTDTASDPEMAANLVRHLLSTEAQAYFAVQRTFEYPVIPELEPIDTLPQLDTLNTPDVDLTQLSELQPTIELMREVGLSV